MKLSHLFVVAVMLLTTSLSFAQTAYGTDPLKEIQTNESYIYTSNSPKSKGLTLSLRLPNSWIGQEARRSNIVQKFQSKYGKEAQVMLMVKDLPEEIRGVSKAEWREYLSDANERRDFAEAMLEDYNGVYLGSGVITLEGFPGFWLRNQVNAERLDNNFGMENITYFIFTQDKMVAIQGMVMTSFNGTSTGASFETYRPLFNVIADSLMIENLYK
ncbi:hypothetical protein [Lonepinella sp. BR2357]|uniref:hypothetical protein n=1 Tax=Lonepinella sp. BR2357 TaxID=3434549 RepID=UPI003F6DD8FD